MITKTWRMAGRPDPDPVVEVAVPVVVVVTDDELEEQAVMATATATRNPAAVRRRCRADVGLGGRAEATGVVTR